MSSEFRAQPQSEQQAPRYREVSIGHAPVQVTEAQGVLHMRSLEPLAELPARLLDRLVHWAQVRPEQTFIAERQADGGWRRVSWRSPRACLAMGCRRISRWCCCRATISSICRSPSAPCTPAFLIARYRRRMPCCPRILPSCGMCVTCCNRGWCSSTMQQPTSVRSTRYCRPKRR